MKQGAKGRDVGWLQQVLRAAGAYEGRIDGRFGPATHQAVQRWQMGYGLRPDGWAGPVTRRSIDERILPLNTPDTYLGDPVVPPVPIRSR